MRSTSFGRQLKLKRTARSKAKVKQLRLSASKQSSRRFEQLESRYLLTSCLDVANAAVTETPYDTDATVHADETVAEANVASGSVVNDTPLMPEASTESCPAESGSEKVTSGDQSESNSAVETDDPRLAEDASNDTALDSAKPIDSVPTDDAVFEVHDEATDGSVATLSPAVNMAKLAATISDIAVATNGAGNPNRSGLQSLSVRFEQGVTVNSATSLKIHNHTFDTPVDISAAALENNGSDVVTWDFSLVGFRYGHYTAELPQSEFVSTVDNAPVAGTFTTAFHILPGDGNGDAIVDFLDLMPLQNNIFGSVGRFGPGDYDGNATVNFMDFMALQNFYNIELSGPQVDFGDAPQFGTEFPTTLAAEGARHTVGSGLHLGSIIDGETDGLPDQDAAGDDNVSDDDDGVIVGALEAGAEAIVTVTARVPSGTPVLNGWMDFNADGDWNDEGEQVFVDQPVSDGVNNLMVSVPADASVGSTFARFRVTNTPGYSYNGLAPDGEVEDYLVNVVAASKDSLRDETAGQAEHDTAEQGEHDTAELGALGAALAVEGLGNPESPAVEPADQPEQSLAGEESMDPTVVDLAIVDPDSAKPTPQEPTKTPSSLDEDLVDGVFDDASAVHAGGLKEPGLFCTL